MNKAKLEKAMFEARRFYQAAQTLSKENKNNTYLTTGTSTNGTVKRASMDLTRALADLRKPG